MPNYDYRCQKCREVFTVERSMDDTTESPCEHCGSTEVTRIWNAFIRSGAAKPDVGQGSKPKPSHGGGSCCGGGCH